MSKPEYLKLDAEAVRLQISVMISQYPILAEDEELSSTLDYSRAMEIL